MIVPRARALPSTADPDDEPLLQRQPRVMEEKFWYLKRCPVFEQLAAEEMAHLEAHSQIKTFERKSLIYLPNDQGDAMLLLVSGRVRIYHITSEGKEALLTFIDPGELFGELSVIGQLQREEFAEAMEKSQLIRIPRSALEEVLRKQPGVLFELTRLIGLRSQKFERRLKSLMFQPNRERLIYLLLELAERYGVRHPLGTALQVKLSHQEMANLIGSTRETVTMVLGELQLEQLVSVQRRQVILRNVSALAAAINQAPPPAPEV